MGLMLSGPSPVGRQGVRVAQAPQTPGAPRLCCSDTAAAQTLRRVRLCDPWTVAHKVPLSMGFPRQEYWSGLLRPPLGDLPDLGSNSQSLMSAALTGGFFTTSNPWEALVSTAGPQTGADPLDKPGERGSKGWSCGELQR